jgi:hypothetical protein
MMFNTCLEEQIAVLHFLKEVQKHCHAKIAALVHRRTPYTGLLTGVNMMLMFAGTALIPVSSWHLNVMIGKAAFAQMQLVAGGWGIRTLKLEKSIFSGIR